MARYLSIDTEATGLELDCYLIQVAMVPVDTERRHIARELAVETLVACPRFEELEPRLNDWVKAHNESLIRQAHAEGIAPGAFREWIESYLGRPEVKAFFEGQRPPFLGKSLSALDIPIFTRYLGKDFMEKHFHHHTLDVTCVARALVDSKRLPAGCESTSKLIRHLGVREDAEHTALSDALDMAAIYFKLLDELAKG